MTPRYATSVRLLDDGCHAMYDDADGWIVSCGKPVAWTDDDGELAYCYEHFRERVLLPVSGRAVARTFQGIGTGDVPTVASAGLPLRAVPPKSQKGSR